MTSRFNLLCWQLRECISAVGKKNPTEPQKEPLKGQPVQMLITLHGNDVAMGDETLGWTLVPITPDTEVGVPSHACSSISGEACASYVDGLVLGC